MDEGGMSRIEEADDGLIHMARKAHRRADPRRPIAENRNLRNRRQFLNRWVTVPGRHEYPDIALDLATRVGAKPEGARIDFLPRVETRDPDAAAIRHVELPAVKATVQHIFRKTRMPQWHPTMWAPVTERKDLAVSAAADEQGIA
jgi:hypothetical protein